MATETERQLYGDTPRAPSSNVYDPASDALFGPSAGVSQYDSSQDALFGSYSPTPPEPQEPEYSGPIIPDEQEGIFKTGWDSFVTALGEGNMKGVASTIKGIGFAIGNKGIADAGIELGAWSEGLSDRPPPRIQDFREIEGAGPGFDWGDVRDSFEYVAGGVGQGLGSTMPIIVGTLGGGAVGGPIGALAGGLSAGFSLNAGEAVEQIHGELKKVGDPEADKKAGIWGLATGMVTTPLDVIGSYVATGAGKMVTGKIKEAVTKTILRRATSGTLKGITVEGATEFAQSMTRELAAAQVSGLEDGDRLMRAINEGLLGAGAGGAMGLAGGAVTGRYSEELDVATREMRTVLGDPNVSVADKAAAVEKFKATAERIAQGAPETPPQTAPIAPQAVPDEQMGDVAAEPAAPVIDAPEGLQDIDAGMGMPEQEAGMGTEVDEFGDVQDVSVESLEAEGAEMERKILAGEPISETPHEARERAQAEAEQAEKHREQAEKDAEEGRKAAQETLKEEQQAAEQAAKEQEQAAKQAQQDAQEQQQGQLDDATARAELTATKEAIDELKEEGDSRDDLSAGDDFFDAFLSGDELKARRDQAKIELKRLQDRKKTREQAAQQEQQQADDAEKQRVSDLASDEGISRADAQLKEVAGEGPTAKIRKVVKQQAKGDKATELKLLNERVKSLKENASIMEQRQKEIGDRQKAEQAEKDAQQKQKDEVRKAQTGKPVAPQVARQATEEEAGSIKKSVGTLNRLLGKQRAAQIRAEVSTLVRGDPDATATMLRERAQAAEWEHGGGVEEAAGSATAAQAAVQAERARQAEPREPEQPRPRPAPTPRATAPREQPAPRKPQGKQAAEQREQRELAQQRTSGEAVDRHTKHLATLIGEQEANTTRERLLKDAEGDLETTAAGLATAVKTARVARAQQAPAKTEKAVPETEGDVQARKARLLKGQGGKAVPQQKAKDDKRPDTPAKQRQVIEAKAATGRTATAEERQRRAEHEAERAEWPRIKAERERAAAEERPLPDKDPVGTERTAPSDARRAAEGIEAKRQRTLTARQRKADADARQAEQERKGRQVEQPEGVLPEHAKKRPLDLQTGWRGILQHMLFSELAEGRPAQESGQIDQGGTPVREATGALDKGEMAAREGESEQDVAFATLESEYAYHDVTKRAEETAAKEEKALKGRKPWAVAFDRVKQEYQTLLRGGASKQALDRTVQNVLAEPPGKATRAEPRHGKLAKAIRALKVETAAAMEQQAAQQAAKGTKADSTPSSLLKAGTEKHKIEKEIRQRDLRGDAKGARRDFPDKNVAALRKRLKTLDKTIDRITKEREAARKAQGTATTALRSDGAVRAEIDMDERLQAREREYHDALRAAVVAEDAQRVANVRAQQAKREMADAVAAAPEEARPVLKKAVALADTGQMLESIEEGTRNRRERKASYSADVVVAEAVFLQDDAAIAAGEPQALPKDDATKTAARAVAKYTRAAGTAREADATATDARAEADGAMFRRPGGRPHKTRKQKIALWHQIVAVAEDIFGAGLTLRQAVQGELSQFSPVGRIAVIALQGSETWTNLGHEGMHYLEVMGVFTKEDMALMERHTDAWMKRYNIAARYPELSAAQQAMEARAEAFGEYFSAGVGAQGALAKLWQKMSRLLRNMRRRLWDSGYREARDVFDDIMSGEMALFGVQASAETLAENRASIDGGQQAVSWAEGVGELWSVVTRRFSRTFESLDPKKYGGLIEQLRRLQGIPNFAAEVVKRDLTKVIGPLTRKQYIRLEQYIVIKDLIETKKKGLEIPSDINIGDIEKMRDELFAVIEKDAKVMEHYGLHVAQRKQMTDMMIREGTLTRETAGEFNDYFHHQVLEYAREMTADKRTAKAFHRTVARPRQHKRYGSKLPINWDYIAAESAWRVKAYRDIQEKRLIKYMKENVDKGGEARNLLRLYNDDNLKAFLDTKDKNGKPMYSREAKVLMDQIERTPEVEQAIADFKANQKEIGKAFASLRKALAGNKAARDNVPPELQKALKELLSNKSRASRRETNLFDLVKWLAVNDTGQTFNTETGRQEGEMHAHAQAASKVMARVNKKKILAQAMVGDYYVPTDSMERLFGMLNNRGDLKRGKVHKDTRLDWLKERYEGYVSWNEAPGMFGYATKSLPEKVVGLLAGLADADLEGDTSMLPKELEKWLKDNKLPKASKHVAPAMQAALRDALAEVKDIHVGGRTTGQFLMPKEVVQTMDDVHANHEANAGLLTYARALRHWKIITLFTPWAVLGYNIVNITGDMDSFISAMPKLLGGGIRTATADFKRAAVELYDFQIKGNDPSPDLKAALYYNTIDGSQSVAEGADGPGGQPVRRGLAVHTCETP